MWYNEGIMPELPEVETIRRGISKLVLNKKIIQVRILEEKSFKGEVADILNTKIVQIRRRGKALIFDLENRYSFLIHLRMTGQIIYVENNRGGERFAGGHPNESFLSDLPNGQTRVIFEFREGKMYFNDQRKFGFVKVMKTENVEKDEFIKKLGKEPWEMSGEELFLKLNKKFVQVKGALLDQTIMAGLGNIYVDETLHFAGISPMRKCCDLSKREVEDIVRGARNVMEKSLESGGSTIRNYVRADGSRGNYLDLFAKVYGREGETCEKCGEKIKKIRVAGRGTYYCERCQK